jgi:hypothetical protein
MRGDGACGGSIISWASTTSLYRTSWDREQGNLRPRRATSCRPPPAAVRSPNRSIAQNLDADLGGSHPQQVQPARRRLGQVQLPSVRAATAIVHPHLHGRAVGQAGDPQDGSHRQGRMRRRKQPGVIGLARGRLATDQGTAVVAGPNLDALPPARAPGCSPAPRRRPPTPGPARPL